MKLSRLIAITICLTLTGCSKPSGQPKGDVKTEDLRHLLTDELVGELAFDYQDLLSTADEIETDGLKTWYTWNRDVKLGEGHAVTNLCVENGCIIDCYQSSPIVR